MKAPAIDVGIAVVVLALFARVGLLVLQGPTIPAGDAANYCRIAQNLYDGIGNVTIRGVPNVLHAPLYPLAMAGVMHLVHDPERSGIVVSLLSGIAVVLLLAGITAAMAGNAAGLVAGAIAAVHPMLVNASIVPMSEALFMALLLAGLRLLVELLRRPSVALAACTGLCFGCAYVTREEGLALLPASVAVIVGWHVRRRIAWGRPVAQLIVLLVAFALPAAPYVAFLSSSTGHLAFEAKSTTNYDLSAKILGGQTYSQAAGAIDAQLRDVGVETGASYPFIGAAIHAPTLAERLRLALQTLPHQLRNLYDAFFFKRNAMIVFTLAAFAGAAWRIAGGLAGPIDLLLTYAVLTEVAALATLAFYWPRFGYTMGALLVPWCACGITLIAGRLRTPHRTSVRRLSAILAAAVVAIWCTSNVLEVRRDAIAPGVFRDAGDWIARHSERGTLVFSNEPVTAYYAGRVFRALPYTDAPTALRYLQSRAPNYLVVSTVFVDDPYLPAWAANGIPGRTPVFSETRGSARMLVYRFADGTTRSQRTPGR